MSESKTNPTGKYDAAVAEFIDTYWLRNLRSPTYREICAATGIPSTSSVRTVVSRIAKSRGDRILHGRAARGIIPKWIEDAIKSAPLPRYQQESS